MQRIVNPQQTRLFDPFDPILTDKTRQRLLDSWPGIFRHVILELLPVDILSGNYSPDMGRPTKELYSMAGLIFMMEFFDWKKSEALNAYSYHMDVHYALNMEPVAHDLGLRTLERYIVLFEKDGLAQKIFHEVTLRLAQLLEIRIGQQRLDSTHIFSDMASFGRTRLMGVAIKRFLTQVIRHDRQAYDALPEALRQRYRPSVHQMFGDTAKDKDSRRLLRQQVAEDMHVLIGHFASHESLSQGTCYQAMERIFYEQCDVHEETIVVKEKTGSDVTQNPSDPEATYDGHKGPGYQVQLSETCDPDNEVQLITSALPQTACQSDADAIEPILDALESKDMVPKELFVDTSYASDENNQKAALRGVDLVGPVPGSRGSTSDEDLTIDDFNIDEASEQVVCCPAGYEPLSSTHDSQSGKTRTVMPESACQGCEYFDQCPIEKKRQGYRLDHTAKQRRVASRRQEESTEVFVERYRIRGGIEGTNSGLKRRTGLGKLRVRGGPRVFHSIYLKVAGWNVLQASVCATIREIVYQRATVAVLCVYTSCLLSQAGLKSFMRGPRSRFRACYDEVARFVRLPKAA